MLDLMVYLVYFNKDVFLWELILNVFDVLDKLWIEVLWNKDLEVDIFDLYIEIDVDKVVRIFIVCDNGIGMVCEEVVDLIGMLVKLGIVELCV